jgi:hypothetical protein
MTGVRSLDPVDRQKADGVDAELLELVLAPDEGLIALFSDGNRRGTFGCRAAGCRVLHRESLL